MARWGLTRLKEKGKQRLSPDELAIDRAFSRVDWFTDLFISVEHPHVAQWLLDELERINPRLQLHWELQHYFEHRWHIKLNENGDLKSIIILQYPWTIKIHQQAEFVPFDSNALEQVRRLCHQLRHGLQGEVIERHLAKNAQDKLDQEAGWEDMANVRDKEERLVQERMSGKRNISDPGWERGVGMDIDGVPFTEGKGAHTNERTSAF